MSNYYSCKVFSLLLSLYLIANPGLAQRFIFEPVNPSSEFWDDETYETNSEVLSIDFRLMDKKMPEVSILNSSTKEEITINSENFIYTANIRLEEGKNTITIWASKYKSKFKKEIKVVYKARKKKKFIPPPPVTAAPVPTALPAERAASTPLACEILLSGSYFLSPQVGSNDIIITRNSQHPFETTFLVNCCEDKHLDVSVENPRNQSVDVIHKAENTFAFQTELFDYESIYTLRASCKSKTIAEKRLIVRVESAFENRLDTAIIFAVTKHKRKARKLGWANLKYAENDALALKWTLENKFGFGVKLVLDPTWEEIHATMESLKEREWDNLDQLFVFFSGHGHIADGRGYLIPSNVSESVKTYYKMEDFREQIDEIPCNNISLNIDACFASTFLERGGKDVTYRPGSDVHELLSADLPFRYFIGSAPANKEVSEKGIFVKDVKKANGKYRYHRKSFKVSEFMQSYLEAIENGQKDLKGAPIPIWYVGRKVEELYRPKKLINGQQVYARSTRFGTQNDKGFHFIPVIPRTK